MFDNCIKNADAANAYRLSSDGGSGHYCFYNPVERNYPDSTARLGIEMPCGLDPDASRKVSIILDPGCQF